MPTIEKKKRIVYVPLDSNIFEHMRVTYGDQVVYNGPPTKERIPIPRK